jgi:uncharacterized metal-binding protein
MASGRNHDRAIYFATPIVFGVGTSYFGIELGLIAGAAHYLGGLYLSPDLDLISRPYKRWGFLRWLWLPYQKLIPRHRHWLSHGVIVGSALRLVYLGAWLSPLLLVFPLSRVHIDSVSVARAIAFFCGVELSAINHLILDGLILPLPKAIWK